jgi:hypothetical protein
MYFISGQPRPLPRRPFRENGIAVEPPAHVFPAALGTIPCDQHANTRRVHATACRCRVPATGSDRRTRDIGSDCQSNEGFPISAPRRPWGNCITHQHSLNRLEASTVYRQPSIADVWYGLNCANRGKASGTFAGMVSAHFSEPVPPPNVVVLPRSSKLELYRDDVLKPFLDLRLLEARRKPVEGKFRETLAAFGIELSNPELEMHPKFGSCEGDHVPSCSEIAQHRCVRTTVAEF